MCRGKQVIMSDKEAREISDLEDKFFINWEKPVDYTDVPETIPHQIRYLVLRRIVETGESVKVASEKLGLYM